MKQTILHLLFSFSFLLTGGAVLAQDLAPCGTDLGISSWLRDFQSRIHSTPRTEGFIYAPVQIHVVGTDQGGGYMAYSSVMRAFCELNEDFIPAEMQFFLAGPVNFISNSAYYDHDFGAGYDMMFEHNVPNAINCYIVQSPAGNCGYYSPGPDAIALSKSCVQPGDNTWAHEVGHYLSLPHPFYGWEYRDEDIDHDYADPAPESWVAGWGTEYFVEKMDGSNCQFAADGFCDTAPDYLDYRWTCNNEGISNLVQHDPNGVPFNSKGDLFMSYSDDVCATRFSDDQIAAMRANMVEQRPNLVNDPPLEDDIIIPEQETLTVISPAAGSIVDDDTVLLEWEPVENATHYLVQVNPFSNLNILLNQFIVYEPRLVFEDLQDNKTFYWHVRPFNEYDTCTDFLEPNSFETGLISSTTKLLPGEQLRIYPNPVSSSRSTSLELISTTSERAYWQIMNTAGQQLNVGQFETASSLQRIDLPTENLSPGLYIVQIQLGDRQATRKLIIQ
ncbi:MAG: zinc-dependent metalloprotease [Bacteroidota bacterium]